MRKRLVKDFVCRVFGLVLALWLGTSCNLGALTDQILRQKESSNLYNRSEKQSKKMDDGLAQPALPAILLTASVSLDNQLVSFSVTPIATVTKWPTTPASPTKTPFPT